MRFGITHHEAVAERVVGVDLRILLSQKAREVGGVARREEFKRGNRHDRACDFLIAVGFLARRKVPFSAEEDFRLDEMKVRYLRCDGTSVWKDVEDWGEEIRLRCIEREITFVTLHGPIQAFGKLEIGRAACGAGGCQ